MKRCTFSLILLCSLLPQFTIADTNKLSYGSSIPTTQQQTDSSNHRDFVNKAFLSQNVPSSNTLGSVTSFLSHEQGLIKPSSSPQNSNFNNLSSGSVSQIPTQTLTSTSSQNTNRRDYVNPNIPIGNSGASPARNLTPPLSPSTNRRDYVNPNIPVGNSGASPTRDLTPPSSPSTNRRDYVNSNIPVGNSGASPTRDLTPPSSPSTNRRDYVNPNIPVGNSGGSSNTNRRDYVNPNIPVGNSGGSPTRDVTPPSSPSTSRRDYVNPNVPVGNSVPSSVPNSPPVFRKEDFPALPSPNYPKSPESRRQTTRTPIRTSTARTNDLATDEEIANLTKTLFSKDTNNQNSNIVVNYQGKTHSSATNDEAPQPLLQVRDEVFNIPTISKMRLLYNNYELDTSVNEYVTPIERQEEQDFLDAVLKTQVMRQAMQFLQKKNIVTPDPATHYNLLKTIWFSMYSRGGGRIGSSAFEHIFLNEIKNGTITGLHNWIYFYEKEKQGVIDYKGYIKKLDLGNKGAIVKYRFDYNGIKKPVNGMFIGTSPELELALYTICFQLRPDRECPISTNESNFILRTYTFRYRGKNLIGSGFPEI